MVVGAAGLKSSGQARGLESQGRAGAAVESKDDLLAGISPSWGKSVFIL